jgi:hypothetical protein
MTPCSPVKVSRRFGGMYTFSGSNNKPNKKPAKSRQQSELCLLSAWLSFLPWRRRLRGPPKRLLTFIGLHGTTSQKRELFTADVVRTSSPKFTNLNCEFFTSSNKKVYAIIHSVCIFKSPNLFVYFSGRFCPEPSTAQQGAELCIYSYIPVVCRTYPLSGRGAVHLHDTKHWGGAGSIPVQYSDGPGLQYRPVDRPF